MHTVQIDGIPERFKKQIVSWRCKPPVKEYWSVTEPHSSESILEYGLAAEVNELSPPSLTKPGPPYSFYFLFILLIFFSLGLVSPSKSNLLSSVVLLGHQTTLILLVIFRFF